MRSQHYGYWCPGAKVPGHQYPQCWQNIHCIGPASYKNIAHKVNSIRKWNHILKKKWPSHLRVKACWMHCLCSISIIIQLINVVSVSIAYDGGWLYVFATVPVPLDNFRMTFHISFIFGTIDGPAERLPDFFSVGFVCDHGFEFSRMNI